jgi:hypothetical protein
VREALFGKGAGVCFVVVIAEHVPDFVRKCVVR